MNLVQAESSHYIYWQQSCLTLNISKPCFSNPCTYITIQCTLQCTLAPKHIAAYNTRTFMSFNSVSRFFFFTCYVCSLQTSSIWSKHLKVSDTFSQAGSNAQLYQTWKVNQMCETIQSICTLETFFFSCGILFEKMYIVQSVNRIFARFILVRSQVINGLIAASMGK